MKKKQKGEFGFLAYKKKTETLKTILYFIIPLALFIAGILTTGTKKNLLSIVAVLGILPASKSAVLMIMYLKSRGLGQDLYEQIEGSLEKIKQSERADLLSHLTMLYEMVFTTQDVTYEVPTLYLYGGTVCGWLQTGRIPKGKDQAILIADLEKHLETSLKKENISANVKMFDSPDAFIKRLGELKVLERAAEYPNQATARVLKQISL